MKQEAMGTSRSEEWETPQAIYDLLDKEFHFQLDPCATDENAKCDSYYTEEEDGLKQDWYKYGSVFINPPYGKKTKDWVEKAYKESQKGCTVVMLIFIRSDTKWWHEWVIDKVDEIRMIQGRLTFGGAKNSSPWPSILLVYRPDSHRMKLSGYYWKRK